MAILGLALFVTDLNLISSAGGAYKRCFELLPSKPLMKCAIPIQMKQKDYSYNFEISWDLTGVKKDIVLNTSNLSYSLIKCNHAQPYPKADSINLAKNTYVVPSQSQQMLPFRGPKSHDRKRVPVEELEKKGRGVKVWGHENLDVLLWRMCGHQRIWEQGDTGKRGL